jgi:hypothetical protein
VGSSLRESVSWSEELSKVSVLNLDIFFFVQLAPASLEADPAEGRVRAPRQQGSKSSVRSKEQARKGHAARKLKRALNAKNLGGRVGSCRFSEL